MTKNILNLNAIFAALLVSSLMVGGVHAVDSGTGAGALPCVCGKAFLPGETCVLSKNIASNATCFNVTAMNVTIDCNGFSIDGAGAAGSNGIYSGRAGTYVKNCRIKGFQHAVFLENAPYARIANNSLYTNISGGNALYIYKSDHAYASGNTVESSGKMGIYLRKSNYGALYNNTAISSTSASQEFAAIYVGSYYGDSTVDTSDYAILQGNAIRATSGQGLSLYIRPRNNGVVVRDNTLLSGTPAMWGFRTYMMANAVIANNSITNLAGTGIYLQSSGAGNLVANNTISTTGHETIKLYQSSNRVDVLGNRLQSTGSVAVFIDSSSNHVFANNAFLSKNLYLSGSSSNNLFYGNNFSSASGQYIQDASSGANFYNTTLFGKGEGNIYANVISGAVQVQGNVSSSAYPSLFIGMNGTGFPYGAASSGGKIIGSAADYAPLTPYYFNNSTTQQGCACGNLSAPNSKCTLQSDLSSDGTCFTVAAPNVTIDCNGHSINGSGGISSVGIYSAQPGTSVEGCRVSGFDAGIFFDNAGQGSIRNTSVNIGNSFGGIYSYGIFLRYADNTVLDGNTVDGTDGASVILESSSGNLLSNTIARTVNGTALLLLGSNGNTVSGAFARSQNGRAAILALSDNNTFSSIVAKAPSASAILFRTSNGNTFRDFVSSSSQGEAIYLRFGSRGNTFSAFDASSVYASALSIGSGSSNTFADSVLSSKFGHAIYLRSSSAGNLFINNMLYPRGEEQGAAQAFVQIDEYLGEGNNTFCLNNFTESGGMYINDSDGGNFYSCIYGGMSQGNIYANVMDGNVSVQGNVSSSAYPSLFIGMNGTGFPYGAASSGGKIIGSAADFAPLTPFSYIVPEVMAPGEMAAATDAWVEKADSAQLTNAGAEESEETAATPARTPAATVGKRNDAPAGKSFDGSVE